jgi:PAS domain S-box-containing protein
VTITGDAFVSGDRAAARDLRRKEEELRESEELLRDFVENGTVALHRVGPDGRILWANRADLEMLGYTADEYIGRPIADFHVDKARVADILARIVAGETLIDAEARLRAKDGSTKYVLINSSGYFRDGKFVHTRCFTRDVTARRIAEEALRANERQLQLITDALPVCVSYIDRDTRYRFVSAAYESWFRRPKDELLGRRVEDVIGPGAYEIVGPFLARALAGDAVTYTGEVPDVGGLTRSIEATYLPQFGGGGEVVGVVALISDVSERKAFDTFRAAAVDRAERLLRITAALADAVSAEEVFEALVDNVAAAVGGSSAGLWLVAEDGRTVKLARAVGYTKTASDEFDSVWLDSNPSIPAVDAIRRGEPIWIPSQEALLRDYPHLRDTATSGRSYRVACLPLMSRERTLGSLGITIEGDDEATDDERGFLLLVARYAGQALERLRLLDGERRSRTAAAAAATRMGVLSRASRTFGQADLNLARRVDEIVREVGSLMGSCVGLSLIERDGQLHTCAVYHPLSEAKRVLESLIATAPVALGEGISGRVAHTGESALIPSVDPRELAARAAGAYRAFLERFPTYAMICAPLRARGKVIGTLTALRTRAGETYTREDLELFEELAERAAPAVENSRLHRENVGARARAEQLYHFAKSVVSAEKVEEVFESALDTIAGALGTDRGAILISDDAQVMRFRAWRHLSEDYRRAVEGHSPWAPDEPTPKPVLVPDVYGDPGLQAYAALFAQERIGSLAFIPLVTRGRLIGKFMVYYREAHAYSSHEVELATAIASHLASVTARFAAIAKLEETIRYNELFSGVLGHDLRSPLGAIITSAQLLLMRGEGRGDRYIKPITRIISSSQRMTRMIDQLLDLTRARAGGGIRVDPSDVNLTDLCAQAIGELEVAYPSWTIQRAGVGDLVGSWDGDRLLQIVSNLVSNAGQHGLAERPIRVNLDGRDPQAVVLEVHNEGAIAPPLIPTLFDPFRGTRHRGESRGLGLGLFIVKELAAAHAGTVDVASSDVDGTTFRVRLPRRAPRLTLR